MSWILFLAVIITVGILVLFHILLLSRLNVSTTKWLRAGQTAIVEDRFPRPLAACGGEHGGVTAETRFAVASIMSGDFALYGLRSTPS